MIHQLKNSSFLKVLVREVNRMTSNKIFLFVTLVGPLLSFIVVMNIFIAGVPSSLPVAVVDDDQSATSRQLLRMIDATRIADICINASSLDEAYDLMMQGKCDAVVSISNGFEADVLRRSNSQVLLLINNTNVVKGGLLQSGIYKVVSTFSTGVKVQTAMKSGTLQSQAIEQVFAVRIDSRPLFNPFTNYSYFIATALMPLLIVVFTLLGSIYTIGMEIREGTGNDWLKSAGNSITTALAGKLLPYIFLMLVNAAVMNFILVYHLGFPLKGYWGAIMLGQLLLIIAYQMVGVILVGLTGNTRLSLSLASAYSMMAFTFSGLTFPLMGMPMLAKIFAHLFPFTYWMDVFIGQGLRSEPLVQTIIPLSALVLFSLLGWFMTARLKQIVTNKLYRRKI